MSDQGDQEAGRRRAIELLEANHAFPGTFSLSVIALGGDETSAAIVAAAWLGQPPPAGGDQHQTVPSSRGKYISHRLLVQVQSAAEVLELFARLRAVTGVVTVL